MKLALGPILYYWPRDTVLAFYRAVERSPVDIVYLGETVCFRRREVDRSDWMMIARALTLAGKDVVLTTQVLVESDEELEYLRAIAGNGRYLVEANDMSAVQMLSARGPFVAGSPLNIYNGEALHFFAALGATRWAAPIEISRDALSQMQSQRPAGTETEVFAYGRLPLTHSHRCFTARRFNLQKQICGRRCLDFPEGLPMRSGELKPFLVLNGTQTQSASVCNLIRDVPEMADLGVDVIRVSPPYAYVTRILELFKDAIDAPGRVDAAAAELEQLTSAPTCDGYWHGAAGMKRVELEGS